MYIKCLVREIHHQLQVLLIVQVLVMLAVIVMQVII